MLCSIMNHDVESLDKALSTWFKTVCVVLVVMVQFLARTICYIWEGHTSIFPKKTYPSISFKKNLSVTK